MIGWHVAHDFSKLEAQLTEFSKATFTQLCTISEAMKRASTRVVVVKSIFRENSRTVSNGFSYFP